MNNRFFKLYYTVIKQNAETSQYLKKNRLNKKSIKTRIILASYLWISTVKEQTS